MKKSAIIHYAFRSIIRQKSRNFFIIFIVCLTCVFSLFTASLFEGKNKQIRTSIIETETGHWQILEEKFWKKNDSFSPGIFTPKLQTLIAPYLSTQELLASTTILHPEGAQELILLGIEPQEHEVLFPLRKHVTGTWPLENLTQNSVVIGKQFAEKLNLAIGDELVITYQDQNKAILNESLSIVGIFHHYGQGFEGRYAYVSKKFLANLLGLTHPDSFHRIILAKDESAKKPQIEDPNLIVKRWNELHPELDVMMRFHQGVTRALVVFMLVIAYVSIMTPVNILWEERRGEVNLLQTLGTSEKILYLISAVEAFIVTIVSLFMALLIWLLIMWYGTQNGLNFAGMGEKAVVRGGILISSTVYPVISFRHTALIVLFHGLIIFGCNYWSIEKLIKAEAFRDER